RVPHGDESTHNLHHRHINLPFFCDRYAEIYPALDKNKRLCETERFPIRQKKFQMVHGAWRDSMTALFKILWRMKHTVGSRSAVLLPMHIDRFEGESLVG